MGKIDNLISKKPSNWYIKAKLRQLKRQMKTRPKQLTQKQRSKNYILFKKVSKLHKQFKQDLLKLNLN